MAIGSHQSISQNEKEIHMSNLNLLGRLGAIVGVENLWSREPR